MALSVSLPPTESTATGAGQVGQTFTITASGTIGGSGSGTLTGGCSGTSGTGSNCIDIGFAINTGGTYSQSARLNTCGVNNMVGANVNSATTPPFSAATFLTPIGTCVPTGTGALVGTFRIGSAQVMDNGGTSSGVNQSEGSSFDFGDDPGYFNGATLQNAAFTCNIVGTITGPPVVGVVQCVKGPTYNVPGQGAPNLTTYNGAFSSIGKWLSGQTYVAYGDAFSAGYMGALMGNPGGQSFPFTAGSSYTVPTTSSGSSTSGSTTIGGVCPIASGGANQPHVPTVMVSIDGGAIENVYPANLGNATNAQCTFPTGFVVEASVNSSTPSITISSTTVTSTGTLSAGATTIDITGGSYTDLTVGSVLSSSSVLFPLVITSCPGGTCGTTGNYGIVDSNTGSLSVTSWTTTITPSGAAQTGPIAQGEIVSGTGLPNGAYIKIGADESNWTGQAGTYTIVCPTTCTTESAETVTVGLQSGSGGSITSPPLNPLEGIGGIATVDTDSNKTGIFVCDNSGAVSGNPLWGMFNQGFPGGLTDPGLCARPFGQHRGLQVSG